MNLSLRGMDTDWLGSRQIRPDHPRSRFNLSLTSTLYFPTIG
jgi:hypothetical protein